MDEILRTSEEKKSITLPWYVPGYIFNTIGLGLDFKLWDYMDLRDYLYRLGVNICEEISPSTRSSNYKYSVLTISMSMYKIQKHVSLKDRDKSWDPVALEARIIAEAICTFMMKQKPPNLGQAIFDIIRANPDMEGLAKLRKLGCQAVHISREGKTERNFGTRITKDEAIGLVQNVFDVVKIFRDNLTQVYVDEARKALSEFIILRSRLSNDRLTATSISSCKNKSCADESKPDGCQKMGCPYLHRDDFGFSEEESLRNLENIKGKKKKKSEERQEEKSDEVTHNTSIFTGVNYAFEGTAECLITNQVTNQVTNQITGEIREIKEIENELMRQIDEHDEHDEHDKHFTHGFSPKLKVSENSAFEEPDRKKNVRDRICNKIMNELLGGSFYDEDMNLGTSPSHSSDHLETSRRTSSSVLDRQETNPILNYGYETRFLQSRPSSPPNSSIGTGIINKSCFEAITPPRKKTAQIEFKMAPRAVLHNSVEVTGTSMSKIFMEEVTPVDNIVNICKRCNSQINSFTFCSTCGFSSTQITNIF